MSFWPPYSRHQHAATSTPVVFESRSQMLSTRRSTAYPSGSDGIAWDTCWNKVQTTSSFYEAFGAHFLFSVCKDHVRIERMQEQVSPCGGVRRRQVSTGSGSSNRYDINLKHKELLASWKSYATTKNYDPERLPPLLHLLVTLRTAAY